MSDSLFYKTLELKINKLSIETLNRLIYRKYKFIPWVGSGISKPNNLPMWGEWIESMYSTIYCKNISDSKLSDYYERGYYSKILDIIYNENPTEFYAEVRNSFELNKIPVNPLGPIKKLTAINDSLIVSTNIDELVEHYLDFKCVLPTEDEEIKRIANGNLKKSVIKLHGTFGNSDSWVLTESQYQSKYANDVFAEIAEKILSLGHFIFIGTSFIGDKPSELLNILTRGKIFANEHFVFLPIMEENIEHDIMKDRRDAFIALKIFPIFYIVSSSDPNHLILCDLIDTFFKNGVGVSDSNAKVISTLTDPDMKVEDVFNEFIAWLSSEISKGTELIEWSNVLSNILNKHNIHFEDLKHQTNDIEALRLLLSNSKTIKRNFEEEFGYVHTSNVSLFVESAAKSKYFKEIAILLSAEKILKSDTISLTRQLLRTSKDEPLNHIDWKANLSSELKNKCERTSNERVYTGNVLGYADNFLQHILFNDEPSVDATIKEIHHACVHPSIALYPALLTLDGQYNAPNCFIQSDHFMFYENRKESDYLRRIMTVLHNIRLTYNRSIDFPSINFYIHLYKNCFPNLSFVLFRKLQEGILNLDFLPLPKPTSRFNLHIKGNIFDRLQYPIIDFLINPNNCETILLDKNFNIDDFELQTLTELKRYYKTIGFHLDPDAIRMRLFNSFSTSINKDIMKDIFNKFKNI